MTHDDHDATILIVPGLRDHVPEHWQTLLEQRLPNARSVPRMDHDKLSCAAWVRDARPVAGRDRGSARFSSRTAPG